MINPDSRISVGIPVYKAERYVGEAIRSVLDQDVDIKELVVVIDASPDNSAEAARKFEAEGVVVLEREQNGGISAARNTALKEFSGDFIAFLDADDVWPEGRLRALLDAVEGGDEVDMAFGMVEQFLCPQIDAERAATLKVPDEIVPATVASGLLATSDVYAKAGVYDENLRVSEFIDWFSRAKDAGFKHKVIPDLVLRRRIHGDNFSLSNKADTSGYALALKRAIDRRRQASSKES